MPKDYLCGEERIAVKVLGISADVTVLLTDKGQSMVILNVIDCSKKLLLFRRIYHAGCWNPLSAWGTKPSFYQRHPLFEELI
jgi:hypothetical protein